METFIKDLANEAETVAFGQLLASILPSGLTIYLQGDLGAGKTTLTRGVLHGLGYEGIVKSPTYTLVEEYQLPNFMLYHFDLYRVFDPEELEMIGIRDYFREDSLCLLEWPQQGEGVIPNADLEINLTIKNNDEGRTVLVKANTKKAQDLLNKLN